MSEMQIFLLYFRYHAQEEAAGRGWHGSTRWTDVTEEELKAYFGVMILMGK